MSNLMVVICPTHRVPNPRCLPCRLQAGTPQPQQVDGPPVTPAVAGGGCGCGSAGGVAAEVPAALPATPYLQQRRPINRFHLAYHLLPVAGRWERHVAKLRDRWELFNGRKVISIAVGDTVTEQETGRRLPLAAAAAVRAALPADAEVVEVQNDATRWELASWATLWSRVLASADPLDAVLYAHGKGVTRPDVSTAHRWADILYELCLGSNKSVDELMRKFPVVGPLKKVGRFFTAATYASTMAASEFHYSGNFWWARAGDVSGRLRGTPVPLDPWGVEAWVGLAYRLEEAGDLWSPAGHYHPYNRPDMARIEAAFAARPRPGVAPVWPRLSVVIGTRGRPTLPRTIASINSQMLPGDELIIKWDASDDWAATPRTQGQRAATGDYLLWMDDDDIYLPEALTAVRRAIVANPGRVLIFKMRRGEPANDVLPAENVVRIGQVSTQMFVVPNLPEKLGVWGQRSGGDFDFLASTLQKFGTDPVWVDEITTMWRPPV